MGQLRLRLTSKPACSARPQLFFSSKMSLSSLTLEMRV
jgi:hypothetical protein